MLWLEAEGKKTGTTRTRKWQRSLSRPE